MKILYGIQGTGQGHMSRAGELLPEFCKHGSVDVLISGYACQLKWQSDITYRKRGISLQYDQNGGVAMLDTLRRFRPIRFLDDIQSIPLNQYDLVISDYEPVVSWAARIAGVPSIALSHQAAFLSSKTPRPPRQSLVAEQLLQRFAPTDDALGLHFRRYDDFVEPPLIREEVQMLKVEAGDHITVYLPAFHSALLSRFFQKFPLVEWHVFSPDCEKAKRLNKVHLRPVGHRPFLESLAACSGVMCSAGFEMTSEAMFLNKKLLVIPIRNQYEQQCNAAALEKLGVKVLSSLKGNETYISKWLEQGSGVKLEEMADPAHIVSSIIRKFSRDKEANKPLNCPKKMLP